MEQQANVSREQFEDVMRSVWWGDSFHAERHPKAPDEYLKAPEQMAWVGWQAARMHTAIVDLIVAAGAAEKHLGELAEAGFGDRLHADRLSAALARLGVA